MMLVWMIGVAVGLAAALAAWIIHLDRRDEIWLEYEMANEEPDFFTWELEIMAGDDDGETV